MTDEGGLTRALERAAVALPSSPGAFPILVNVHVATYADAVMVSATNLELTVTVAAPARIEREGSGIFPGRRLLEVARAAGQDALTLDARGGKATVSTARTTWEMPLAHGSAYPTPPTLEGLTALGEVPVKAFAEALQTVRVAMSRDTTRPPLRMVDVAGGQMRAADGARYVVTSVGEVPDLHIPAAAVDVLVSALGASKRKNLGVFDVDQGFAYLFDGAAIHTRKLVERFPAVEREMLLPAIKNNDQALKVNRDALIDTVRRVRVAADPDTDAVVLKLAKRSMEVRARDRAGNTAREGLRASWKGEDGRSVAFHHQMLTDALRSADGEEVTVWFANDRRKQRSPGIIKGRVTTVLAQVRAD